MHKITDSLRRPSSNELSGLLVRTSSTDGSFVENDPLACVVGEVGNELKERRRARSVAPMWARFE